MSKILCLYDYNNYFNRTLKRFSTYDEYKYAQIEEDKPYIELPRANFDISDGVNAQHIINVSSVQPAYTKNPNYLVLEDNDGVLSRWFVLECVRMRGGQYKLSLRRDVITDYFDTIKTSPCFIQKGMVSYDSPLIFNNEGMSFNEIKTKELLLKDYSKSAWVVGYIARKEDAPSSYTDISAVSETISKNEIDYDELPQEVKDIINGDVTIAPYTTLAIYCTTRHGTELWGGFVNNIIENNSITGNYKDKFKQTNRVFLSRYGTEDLFAPAISEKMDYYDILNSAARDRNMPSYITPTISSYIGKIIIKDGKKYTLSLRQIATNFVNKDILGSDLDSTYLGLAVKALKNRIDTIPDFGYDRDYYKSSDLLAIFWGDYNTYRVTLQEGVYTTVSTEITANHNTLSDAPYDMFAIPYNEVELLINNEELQEVEHVNTIGSTSLTIARAISLKLGSNCYDIQLLPYCPCLEMLDEGKIYVDTLVEDKDYSYIKDNDGNIVNIMLYPIRSKGTFDITIDMSAYPELAVGNDVLDKKVKSETIKVQLVSPNYAGVFIVNPQKNEGISVVNIDWNYKPYTPYIHVAPVFNGLYGGDFNDARGLICGGDFSISTVASKWEEYQIQNKNYENVFNRQIQNMDFNNSLNMQKAQFSAVTNTIGAGIATGASATLTTGNPIVGVAAGAVGAGVSAVGGAMDVNILAKQQSENRSYAVDMYNFSLGNIKALPYTLSKVSTFNDNNKIYPFIEIYDCTDIEKENLRSKIKYNGMTVMVQGKIEDYLNESGETYIQAQLIRLEGIDDDSHLISEIYNELMKGVYVWDINQD